MAQMSNHQAVAAVFDRLGALDVEGFLAIFDAQARQLLPFAPTGFPAGFEGKAQLERAYRQLFASWQELRFPELSIEPMADPERFFATYSTDMRFADGRRYANRYAATFTARQGRVIEWIEWFDPITLERQLGNPFTEEP